MSVQIGFAIGLLLAFGFLIYLNSLEQVNKVRKLVIAIPGFLCLFVIPTITGIYVYSIPENQIILEKRVDVSKNNTFSVKCDPLLKKTHKNVAVQIDIDEELNDGDILKSCGLEVK